MGRMLVLGTTTLAWPMGGWPMGGWPMGVGWVRGISEMRKITIRGLKKGGTRLI